MNIDTLKEHYLAFEGRLNRKAFILRSICFGLVSSLFILPLYFATQASPDSSIFFLLFIFVELLCIWPTFSLYVRRLHDIDKSAWWLLLLFVPLIGGFFALYLLFRKGTDGANRFGDDPLSPSAAL